jgi:2-polyprenyl-3-methyl-5-hydroxy-6-metoxy-1,4-benzoquinol methylase
VIARDAGTGRGPIEIPVTLDLALENTQRFNYPGRMSASGCNLCGEEDRTLLFSVRGFDIVKCRRCDLVAVGNPPNSKELSRWYDNDFFKSSNPRLYDDYLAARERRESEFQERLRDIGRFFPSPGRLLEIGAAYGLFLNVARQADWKVAGVELSPAASDYARNQLCLDVFTGDISDLTMRTSSDLVVGFDVIEHVADPMGTLRAVNSQLVMDGVVVLTTGNMACIGARLYGPHWSLMCPPWHLYYFTAMTLGRMLERAGMKTISVRYEGNPFYNRNLTRFDWLLAKCFANHVTDAIVTKVACAMAHGMTFALSARKVREV